MLEWRGKSEGAYRRVKKESYWERSSFSNVDVKEEKVDDDNLDDLEPYFESDKLEEDNINS